MVKHGKAICLLHTCCPTGVGTCVSHKDCYLGQLAWFLLQWLAGHGDHHKLGDSFVWQPATGAMTAAVVATMPCNPGC